MNLTHNPTYANLPSRAAAGLIDWQIKSLISLFSFSLLVNISTLNQLIPALFFNLAYIWLPLSLIFPLLILFMLSRTGYTPGKLILSIRVADINQQLLSFNRAIFRELIAKRVSAAIFMLGFLNIAVDPNHQGWHDRFSDSYVFNHDARLVLGCFIVLILTCAQIYLGYTVVTQLTANQALIQDLHFIFEPLLNLIK